MSNTTYTPTQLRAMTDDELRVALAERLGYRWIHVRYPAMASRFRLLSQSDANSILRQHPGSEVANRPTEDYILYREYSQLPHWPTDRAVVWELEESLTAEQRETYVQQLGSVTLGTRQVFRSWHDWAWDVIQATPRQRCEAYVLATNPMEGV